MCAHHQENLEALCHVCHWWRRPLVVRGSIRSEPQTSHGEMLSEADGRELPKALP